MALHFSKEEFFKYLDTGLDQALEKDNWIEPLVNAVNAIDIWLDHEENNFEFRMTQGLKFFLPSIKQLPLKNYFRMEQRFQKIFDGSNWNASLRFRYKISTIIEWKKHLFEFNKDMDIIPLPELLVFPCFSKLWKRDKNKGK